MSHQGNDRQGARHAASDEEPGPARRRRDDRDLRTEQGDPEDRRAWRETPYFTDAERAALALTENVTRLADRPDAVSDEVWDEAAKHYDEQGLAALVLYIATTNLFNRLNAATRQIAGAWG